MHTNTTRGNRILDILFVILCKIMFLQTVVRDGVCCLLNSRPSERIYAREHDLGEMKSRKERRNSLLYLSRIGRGEGVLLCRRGYTDCTIRSLS